MFLFIVRRILVSIPILVASFFVVFGMVTISGDPLAFLRESQSPNRDQQIAQLSASLGLNDPFISRFWEWITGIVTLDFGVNKRGQNVWPILTDAVTTTFRLVLLATVISILIGVAVGILSAIRQYSSFDYGSTLAAFLFFSLPVFWLAVLLKQFGAISFNDWLEQPSVGGFGLAALAIATGLFWAAFIGGSRTRRLLVGLGAAGTSVLLLLALQASGWLENPGLSPIALVVGAAVIGLVSTLLFGGLDSRRVLIPAVLAAVTSLAMAFIFGGWLDDPSWAQLGFMTALALALGAAAGVVFGGIDRRAAVSAGLTSSFLVGALVLTDRFMSAWTPGRTVATVGPQTPNLSGTFWERMIDYAGHQVLPTLALALIGFATFSRFTRASMLETMGSDYVRTAKAKGLRPAQVILRHGFRTALIPVVTVITLSFATIIEGATITETVFGWEGMGQLFVSSLRDVDPYPIMGFMVVVALTIVVVNAIADILYAYLDPRIRL